MGGPSFMMSVSLVTWALLMCIASVKSETYLAHTTASTNITDMEGRSVPYTWTGSFRFGGDITYTFYVNLFGTNTKIYMKAPFISLPWGLDQYFQYVTGSFSPKSDRPQWTEDEMCQDMFNKRKATFLEQCKD